MIVNGEDAIVVKRDKITGDELNIVAGTKFTVDVPYDCTITGWFITADYAEQGTIKFDIRKTNQDVPDSGDSILDGNYLCLCENSYNESSDLSDWTTTTINEGDVLSFVVTEDANIKYCTLQLWVTKV